VKITRNTRGIWDNRGEMMKWFLKLRHRMAFMTGYIVLTAFIPVEFWRIIALAPVSLFCGYLEEYLNEKEQK